MAPCVQKAVPASSNPELNHHLRSLTLTLAASRPVRGGTGKRSGQLATGLCSSNPSRQDGRDDEHSEEQKSGKQPRKAGSARRGRAHLESGEIDVQSRTGSAGHDQETAPRVQLQPEARQIGSGQGIEVDAAGSAIARVQSMDERRLPCAVIRVYAQRPSEL